MKKAQSPTSPPHGSRRSIFPSPSSPTSGPPQSVFDSGMLPLTVRGVESCLPLEYGAKGIPATPPPPRRTRYLTASPVIAIDKRWGYAPGIGLPPKGHASAQPHGVYLRGERLPMNERVRLYNYVREATSVSVFPSSTSSPTVMVVAPPRIGGFGKPKNARRGVAGGEEEFFVVPPYMARQLRLSAARAKQVVTARLVGRILASQNSRQEKVLMEKVLTLWRNTYKAMRFGRRMTKRSRFSDWQSFVFLLWVRRNGGCRILHAMARKSRLGRIFVFWRRYTHVVLREREGIAVEVSHFPKNAPHWLEWSEWLTEHNKTREVWETTRRMKAWAAIQRVIISMHFQTLVKYTTYRKDKARRRRVGAHWKADTVDPRRTKHLIKKWQHALHCRQAAAYYRQHVVASTLSVWVSERKVVTQDRTGRGKLT